MMMGGNLSATTDQRGEFTIPDVPEGRYEARVQKGGGGEMSVMPGGNVYFRMGGGPDPAFWRQEVLVRAEATSRISAGFQTGFLKGKLLDEAGAPGTFSGSLTLYQGVSSVPGDLGEFEKQYAVVHLQARGGTFQSQEILAGEWLLVLQSEGREAVQKQITVPTGDTLAVDVAVGKVVPKR
jgi:hypothetical protein